MNTIEPADDAALQAECRRLREALLFAEQDRQHLLCEIHDGVIQDLTAASLLLEGAGRQASFASPEAADNFDGGLRLLRDAIAHARQLLRTGTIALLEGKGLVEAIEHLVNRARTELKLNVSLTTNCAGLQVSPPVQHLLLRVIQESLSNVWKHAHASEVEVQLWQRDDFLELIIADNGVGFDPALVSPGHFGLESIRSRAAALGAELVFDTAPSHGMRVVVRLPEPGSK